MTVTISPDQMQAWAIAPPRADGVVEAYKLSPMMEGGLAVQYAAKFPAWTDFINVGGFPLFGDEVDIAEKLIETGGLWDSNAPSGTGPTWRELYNGASWTQPDGQVVAGGIPSFIARIQWWLKGQTTRTCEAATDAALFRGYVLEEVQYFRDFFWSQFVYPGDPTPRVPAGVLWPPERVGAIASCNGLMEAQSSRITARLDPNNPNRTLIDAVSVP